MNTYRAIILAAFVAVTTVSCAGSPTSPNSNSLPRPNVHSVGTLSWDLCINGQCDGFHFDVTNDGPGCANPIGLHGTASLREGQTVAKTTDWQLTLGSQNAGVFRPGQTLAAQGSFGTMTDIAHHAYTADVVVTSETAISCQ
jgi:hypothetical protein